MIVNKNGNILYSEADIICQQVNCQGVMGSGFAREIRRRYPMCYDEYKKFCQKHNSHDLLGRVCWVTTDMKALANVFGQLNYGRIGTHTSYTALLKGLEEVHKIANEENFSVAIPNHIGV